MTKTKLIYIFLVLTMVFVLFFTNIHKNLYKNENIESVDSIDEEETTIDEFKINPKELICQTPSNKPILFIAFVIIAPLYFEKRDLIRSTWGNKSISDDFKIIFTIGMSKNETINRQIEEEHKINQDILLINNFIDSRDSKLAVTGLHKPRTTGHQHFKCFVQTVERDVKKLDLVI